MEPSELISSSNPDVIIPGKHQIARQIICSIIAITGIFLLFTEQYWDIGLLLLIIATIIFIFRKTQW